MDLAPTTRRRLPACDRRGARRLRFHGLWRLLGVVDTLRKDVSPDADLAGTTKTTN